MESVVPAVKSTFCLAVFSLGVIAGFIGIVNSLTYTPTLLSLFLVSLSVLCILDYTLEDLSQNCVVRCFPFMETAAGKAIIYALIGLAGLGKETGWVGYLLCGLMISVSALTLLPQQSNHGEAWALKAGAKT